MRKRKEEKDTSEEARNAPGAHVAKHVGGHHCRTNGGQSNLAVSLRIELASKSIHQSDHSKFG